MEIVLIFAVFAIQGAWPVPDVNETHYLGKVIHYWRPGSLQNDFFMDSPDTHKVFCLTFGWLSLWLGPTALAWTGRVLAWGLLAWAWRRLSVAIVPRAWYSVLTAALFACLMTRCQMAGEWVIGGLEAKPFAYVFVLLGIESLVRERWNRALMLFGAAAAFHAIVGGWSAVAAGVAWLTLKRSDSESAPSLRRLWPGIVGGLLLSLPGLATSIGLDWGTDREAVRAAHQIYVFERLPHHLTLGGMRPEFILRLAALWVFWLVLGRWSKRVSLAEDSGKRVWRLRRFVAGAVAITLVGAAVNLVALVDRPLAADLLRYYWFRLTDVAIPLGVAVEGVAVVVDLLRPKESPGDVGSRLSLRVGRLGLVVAIVVGALHVGTYLPERLSPSAPRSYKGASFADWRAACRWVAESGRVPVDARFFVPRLGQTFKWYAGRSDVVNWKDVPQDAKSLLEWQSRIKTIYMTDLPEGPRWYDPLTMVGEKRLRELATKYGADFIIAERTDPPAVGLRPLYQNNSYVIYQIN